jgi:hypothetical protein
MKLLVPIMTAAVFFQFFQEVYVTSNLKFNPEYIAYDPGSSLIYSIPTKKGKKEKLDVSLESGPEKGIKTTAAFAKIYNGILSDLSEIKKHSDGPVYVAMLYPWFYLYLDLPYATGSTWCLTYEVNFEAEKQRLLDYCDLHPEKIPKTIYIPKTRERLYLPSLQKTKEILEQLHENFDFTAQESDYGYTLEIINYYKSSQ